MKNCYKTSLRKIVLSTLLALGGTGLVSGQLIVNSDLEAWAPNCPLNDVPNSWTNFSTPGSAPDQAGSCAGTVTAHSGNSYMNLVWINSGVLEGAVQTISGLTLGRTYRVTFWGINSQGLYANPGDCKISIHQNSLPVFSTPNLVSGGAWTMYTFDFVSNALSEVVGVQVAPGTSGTSGSAGVDDFQVTELVSATDDMLDRVTVYPSPATGAIFIDQGDYYLQDLQGIPCSITNMVGQTVLTSTLDFSGGKARLDLQGFRPGVYSLSMRIEGLQEVHKFMVR